MVQLFAQLGHTTPFNVKGVVPLPLNYLPGYKPFEQQETHFIWL